VWLRSARSGPLQFGAQMLLIEQSEIGIGCPDGHLK
jgi:hypothetical protein